MKKLIALILVAALCFSLGACGGEPQASNSSLPDVFADTAENVVFLVRFSINPEFELHIDQDGNVVALNCLNADAQKAFAGISVQNIPFETAFRKLLDGILDHGYITGNSVQIYIAPYLEAGASFDDSVVIEGINRVCDQFRTDTGIGVGTVIGDINAGMPEQIPQEGPQGDESSTPGQQENDSADEWEKDENITIERDENGNIVKYIFTEPNGNKIEYNANKQIIAEKWADGTCTIYDSDGNPVEITSADGSKTTRTFHTNGKVATETSVNSDGSTHYAEFDTAGQQIYGSGKTPIDSYVEDYVNGIRTLRTAENPDAKVVTKYNADGTLPIEETTYYASGGYLIRKYEYNGTVLTKYTEDKDGDTFTIYDANRNKLEYFGQNNFGYPVHFIYNPDGSATVKTTMPDGTIATSYVDANGNLIQ